MTVMRISTAVALIGVPLLVWAGDDATETKKLQGTWETVTLVDKGKSEPEERIKMLKLHIKDDKYIYDVSGKKFSASFKFQLKEKPPGIDITFEEGPVKGKTMKAIYELDGDTLKICGGDERPKDFTATKDNILFTFKREKKK